MWARKSRAKRLKERPGRGKRGQLDEGTGPGARGRGGGRAPASGPGGRPVSEVVHGGQRTGLVVDEPASQLPHGRLSLPLDPPHEHDVGALPVQRAVHVLARVLSLQQASCRVRRRRRLAGVVARRGAHAASGLGVAVLQWGARESGAAAGVDCRGRRSCERRGQRARGNRRRGGARRRGKRQNDLDTGRGSARRGAKGWAAPGGQQRGPGDFWREPREN